MGRRAEPGRVDFYDELGVALIARGGDDIDELRKGQDTGVESLTNLRYELRSGDSDCVAKMGIRCLQRKPDDDVCIVNGKYIE